MTTSNPSSVRDAGISVLMEAVMIMEFLFYRLAISDTVICLMVIFAIFASDVMGFDFINELLMVI